MAEQAEKSEQQKQTKILEGIDKKEAQADLALGKITSVLKEANAIAVLQHDESEAGKEELNKLTKDALEKQSEDLRSQTKLAEDQAKMEKARDAKTKTSEGKKDKEGKQKESRRGEWFEKTGNWFSQIKKDADDDKFFEQQKFKYEGGFFTRQLKSLKIIEMSTKEQQKHDTFMADMAKQGNWFQRKAHNMAVRAAKLALRGGKAVKDWGVKGLTKMKDKAFSWIKSLGKLLVLLGIWGAALWLDANMLKEDWDKVKEKMVEWKNKLVGFWKSLTKVWDDVVFYWSEIKSWFCDVFGVELKLWHVALLAFGLWLVGPKLLFMATFWAAKGAFWGIKKMLGWVADWFKDDPDGKGMKKKGAKAARKTGKLRRWWRRMFGLADDSADALKYIDPKDAKNARTATSGVTSWWKKMFGIADDQTKHMDDVYKSIYGMEETKPSYWSKIKTSFSKMFSTVGNWASSIGDKVGGWFKSAKTSVGGWFKDSWSKAKDLGKSIVDKGKKAFDATIDAAKTLGKGVLDKSKKIVTGAADLVKGAGKWVAKIPGVKTIGKFLGGAVKTVAKVAAPLEAARGTMAGFASTGEGDERTMNQRMDDASAGMTKSLFDFFAVDLVDLGGMLENVVRTDLKEGEEGWLSGVAKAMREKSDLAFGKWVEGTELMDAGGDLTALRLDTPEAKKRAQAEQRAKMKLMEMSEVMGLTKSEGKSIKSKGWQKFDKEGFQRLLLSASKDESFAKMTQMIAGLSKLGKISAEDAERYKMEIAKEQAAGTAPIIINNAPTTNNNAGGTSVLSGTSSSNPMQEVLKDW